MQTDKIKLPEKIGFALTNLGNIPIMTLLNTYLLIFYTDILGISPAVVSTIFLVSRMLDGISDPLLGFLIDRLPRTKFGKYRLMLILGSIVCCINYLLVWFAPVIVTEHKIVVIAISYILLGITFDLMDIPLNSLIPVLTQKDSERNVLSSIKGISYTIGPTILNVIAPLIIANHDQKLSGYVILIVGTVITVLFFTIVGALVVKERVIDSEVETVTTSKYSIKEAIKIFKITSVRTLFLSMLFITAATNIFNGSLLYYLIYLMEEPRILSIASMLGLVGALIAGSLVPVLSTKYGKENIYVYALLLLSFSMIIMIGSQWLGWLILLGYFLLQFSLGFTNTLQYSISADNVDKIKQSYGFESAALIASLNSLIMKFAMAMGGAIPGFVLSYSGYIANQKQTSSAGLGIVVTTFVIPFALYLLTLIVFKYGYSSKNGVRNKLLNISQDLRQEKN